MNDVAERNAARSAAVGMGLVLLALVAVFGRGLDNGYTTVDDEALIFLNPIQQHFGLREIGEAFDPRTSRLAYGLQYTPLTDLSYALDRRLFGDAPGPYHLQPLLFHALAALAVFLLVRTLSGPPSVAIVAALIFAIHPLQVESVTWIAGRDTPLAGMLVLWAMLAWLRARARGSAAAYVASLALVVFANLAKQSAVVSVLLLAAVEWAAVALGRAPRRRAGQIALAYAPQAVLSLGFTWLGMTVGRREGIIAEHAQGIGEQLRLSSMAAGWYANKILLPAGLLPAYQTPVPETWLDPAVAGGVAAVAAAVAAFALWRRTSPLGAAGVLIVLASILPGVHGWGTMVVADRYAYLALTGVGIIAAVAASELARRVTRLALPAAVVAGSALAVVSFVRVGVWHDDVTLFRDAVAKEPHSALWHHLLGRGLMDAGRNEEGLAAFEQARQLSGGNPVTGYCALPPVLAQVGLLRERQGDYDAAEAALVSALENSRVGEVDLAGVNLGAFYLRRDEPEKARIAYLRAIARDPQGTRLCRERLAWVAEHAAALCEAGPASPAGP